MNRLHRIALRTLEFALPIYLILVGINAAGYYHEYRAALTESQKQYYGPRLKQAWLDYSKRQHDELTSPGLLIPFSGLVIKEPPLRFRVEGGLNIKVDW